MVVRFVRTWPLLAAVTGRSAGARVILGLPFARQFVQNIPAASLNTTGNQQCSFGGFALLKFVPRHHVVLVFSSGCFLHLALCLCVADVHAVVASAAAYRRLPRLA